MQKAASVVLFIFLSAVLLVAVGYKTACASALGFVLVWLLFVILEEK